MLWGHAVHSSAKQSFRDLFRATPGSAGLDLSSSAYTVLTPEMGVQALPTGIYGPLLPGTAGLLLGRSSATMAGLMIAPGVIDGDYTGEIKIMTSSPTHISVIQPGQRIAQLLLIPLVMTESKVKTNARGSRGFGSSDAYWVQAIKAEKPELVLRINGKKFKGLLDTGADVSVITSVHWPGSWPKTTTITQLQGIGQSQSPEQSSDLLHWEDEEGHQGYFQPSIVSNLPVNLWGRDIMKDMGVLLYSPNSKVTQQMFDCGYLPNQGLGKQNQGELEPIVISPRKGRTGLGYF